MVQRRNLAGKVARITIHVHENGKTAGNREQKGARTTEEQSRISSVSRSIDTDSSRKGSQDLGVGLLHAFPAVLGGDVAGASSDRRREETVKEKSTGLGYRGLGKGTCYPDAAERCT